MHGQTMNNDVTLAGGENPLLAGRYHVVRQLGTGGMGSVWLAEDRQLDNKPFAVKMLPSVLVANKRAYRQLKDEALVAMKLVHPNIVQIRAFEENDGNPFLVMDYIEGQTLDDYLAEHTGTTEVLSVVGSGGRGATALPLANEPGAQSIGSGTRPACPPGGIGRGTRPACPPGGIGRGTRPACPPGGIGRAGAPRPPQGGLPESEVIRILKPIAAALDYAHGEGVVHRDVKPANVMIRKDGHPFILDFGIAREIQETMTRVTGRLSSGTLLYMSPEQLDGDPPKKEQDVYSFAAMAYECLKGEPPFVRGAIEDQIRNKVPGPLPGGPRSVAAAIMSGLAKKPEDRPPTCAAVLEGDGFSRVERVEEVWSHGCDGRVGRLEEAGARVPRDRDGRATSLGSPVRNIARIAIPVACIAAALLIVGVVLWHRESQRQEDLRSLGIALQEELSRRQAEDERKAQEAAARKKAEAERLAKLQQEDAQRKAKEEAERKAKEEAARIEAERKAKEEKAAAEQKAREIAEREAEEEAERRAKEEAARIEAERKAKEEKAAAERKAREIAEREAKEEAERKAKEEAARIEAERKAKEEKAAAERKAREIAEREAEEKRIAAEARAYTNCLVQIASLRRNASNEYAKAEPVRRSPEGLDSPIDETDVHRLEMPTLSSDEVKSSVQLEYRVSGVSDLTAKRNDLWHVGTFRCNAQNKNEDVANGLIDYKDNVRLSHDLFKLRCDRLIVMTKKDEKDLIQRLLAIGNVKIDNPLMKAQGAYMSFSVETGEVSLSGEKKSPARISVNGSKKIEGQKFKFVIDGTGVCSDIRGE